MLRFHLINSTATKVFVFIPLALPTILNKSTSSSLFNVSSKVVILTKYKACRSERNDHYNVSHETFNSFTIDFFSKGGECVDFLTKHNLLAIFLTPYALTSPIHPILTHVPVRFLDMFNYRLRSCNLSYDCLYFITSLTLCQTLA